jgi:hypothetical protein
MDLLCDLAGQFSTNSAVKEFDPKGRQKSQSAQSLEPPSHPQRCFRVPPTLARLI